MLEFGTGGFRGIIADDFNKNNLKLIAQAISNIYHEKKYNTPIYIGYDYRFMSDYASVWISETLAANNIKTIISSTAVTSPEIMFTCKKNKVDFGLMITASHNPYFYNGVKAFQQEGMDAEKTLTDLIEEKINSLKEYKSISIQEGIKNEYISYVDVHEDFINNIGSFLTPIKNKNIKVLIDPLFGTGSITLNHLLNLMGINNSTIINNTHDPLFGGMVPNPTKVNMLKDAEIVRKEHFDLAIGTDSDCDRLGVLDENGNYVDANEILASLYYYLVKYRGLKGDIVKNLATSNLVDKVAEKLGFKCHEVDVGFKNISSTIKKYDALIGGESSGGLTIRNYIFGKDSTFSCALFLEMVANLNKPVSQIIKEVKNFANFHYVILEDQMNYKDKEYILNCCKEKQPNFTYKIVKEIHLNNNYKYYFEDGSWALLRFSGTERVIRIFVEMPSYDDAKENVLIIKNFVTALESVGV